MIFPIDIPEHKCPKCRINLKLCFCDAMIERTNKTSITVLMHHRETHLNTSTAIVAHRILKNSKIVLRGLPEKHFEYSDLMISEDEIPYYLFPTDDAILLDDDFVKAHEGKKVHLIVPDGSWTQAKKVYRREKCLHHIKCVKLSTLRKSEYELRKSPREDGVCTFEAIAYALGAIESEKLEQDMIAVLKVMVDRFKRARFTYPD